MIEKTLYAALTAIPLNIFPGAISQEQAMPAAAFARIKTEPTNSLSGTNRRHDNGLFQIDLYSEDYLEMADLVDQIIDKMVESFGANSLLRENKDDLSDSIPGRLHRILVFSLRELREEGGS